MILFSLIWYHHYTDFSGIIMIICFQWYHEEYLVDRDLKPVDPVRCVRAIKAHRIILRRSVLRQTQKHFRRILTGIHTTQL